jgi:hypothetical protein
MDAKLSREHSLIHTILGDYKFVVHYRMQGSNLFFLSIVIFFGKFPSNRLDLTCIFYMDINVHNLSIIPRI